MHRWVHTDRLLRDRATYLALFALVFIPLFTYLFATHESPFEYTMSQIGNKLGYRFRFIVWGIVTGLLITFYVIRLFVLKSFHNRKARKLLVWSLIFLILTVLIPAMEHLPILKRLHAVAAVAFALCLMASLYLFIRHLESEHKKVSERSLWMLYLVVGGSVGLFFLLGNTGIFELFFFGSLTIFLGLLNRWLHKYELIGGQDAENRDQAMG